MATGRIGTTPVLQVRWSKAPSAGTTSLSGADDNSVTLVYSVGYEAVYRNGVLLSRGNDYTATNGTTITLIDETIAGDIIEVFANQTVPLSDTYSQSVSNAKFINNTLTTTTGDVIYASAANTPARLGIGSSGQVLTVASGIPSWAAASSGGMTLLTSGSFNDTSTQLELTSISNTYENLRFVLRNFRGNYANAMYVRFNSDANSNRHFSTATMDVTASFNDTWAQISDGANTSTNNGIMIIDFFDYANTSTWKFARSLSVEADPTISAPIVRQRLLGYNQVGAISSLLFKCSGTTNLVAGSYELLGVK